MYLFVVKVQSRKTVWSKFAREHYIHSDKKSCIIEKFNRGNIQSKSVTNRVDLQLQLFNKMNPFYGLQNFSTYAEEV